MASDEGTVRLGIAMSGKTNEKPSKIEGFKRAGRNLRGTIAESLASASPHFGDADLQLLKFHGIYQQDDRDRRHELRAAGREKAHQFMIRVAVPAGVLGAGQYQAFDKLADEYANGSLRATSRQGLQFHGVLKGDLKAHIARINDVLATTLSACGDVERNVMASPAPLRDEAHTAIRGVARSIADELRPASRAYHEIWLEGEKILSTEQEEAFYGDQYLPRKFKTGVTLAGDNSIDIYSHDAGLIGIEAAGRIVGFNVLVGGGQGMTHNRADTFARLATPLGFIEPQNAVETIRTIASIYRDHGNRGDRRHARLKYLITEWGIDRFRDEFRRRAQFELHEWREIPEPKYHDYVGPHPHGDGKYFYGIFLENGRIVDSSRTRLKSALRTIVNEVAPGITLTPNQSLLLTDLDRSGVAALERILDSFGVPLPGHLSAARRYSMACPALPTCGLALAESERLMPAVLDRFEAELDSLDLRDEPITVRMTGCPNGCARPYTADVGFVGRGPGVYHVYVGGGLGGNRLADLYAADVRAEELIDCVRPLLVAWAEDREPGEGLSDFYHRLMGCREPRRMLTGQEQAVGHLVPLEVRL